MEEIFMLKVTGLTFGDLRGISTNAKFQQSMSKSGTQFVITTLVHKYVET